MNEQQVLETIAAGATAEDLLLEADPKIKRRWSKLCKDIVQFRADVQKHFPDAQYYTASGGFHLLLGEPHDRSCRPQQQLLALSGMHGVRIGDGDW